MTDNKKEYLIDFGRRVKNLRLQQNMTLEELANKMGYTTDNARSSIQKIEAGKTDLPQSKIRLLANVLYTTPAYLMGWEDETPPKKGVKIPVLGRVAAGIPIDAIEEIIDYEEIDEHMASQGEFFALQVKGDSMNPRFVDGDVVIVRKQNDADTGDIAIILINGEDATIKRIQKFEGGMNLIPTNPAFDILTFTKEQIKDLPVVIIGKVVELRGKF